MMGISSSVNLGFNLQQTAQKAGERFKAADTDSDEHISRKEFGDFAELRGIDSNRMNKIFARAIAEAIIPRPNCFECQYFIVDSHCVVHTLSTAVD